ncbi:MAG: multifunctional CCA addition/repair protein [bacterium]
MSANQFENMESYLVGGHIRDVLLNQELDMDRAPADSDWVVVGSTPEELLSLGFTSVGVLFPVFLHPDTREEYALARAERSDPGRGSTHAEFSPDVTLEEDLSRRDLTINAMAIGRADAEDALTIDTASLIDPFDGLSDLKNRVLRHVGDSFSDDPVRVLRLARIGAELPDFHIAEETVTFVRNMAGRGELANLTPERVWAETRKALMTDSPSRYFQLLDELQCLTVVFPELAALKGVPQPAEYHPEIDSFVHTLLALDQTVKLEGSLGVRAAVLVHDFGKALTPRSEWPSHRQHEKAGIPIVKDFCKRLRLPKKTAELCLVVTAFHLKCHMAMEMRAGKIARMIRQTGGYRLDGRLDEFIVACEADARGRAGKEEEEYPQGDYLHELYLASRDVSVADQIQPDDTGDMIQEKLHRARSKAISGAIKLLSSGSNDAEAGSIVA